MAQYLVDGEWLEKPEADREMMLSALRQIALAKTVTIEMARDLALDTLGFVEADKAPVA